MENCEIKVEGDTLIVRVDLKKRLRPSGTGKTVINEALDTLLEAAKETP